MFIKKHTFRLHGTCRGGSKSGQNGFTLIELIITISIMALLGIYAASEIAKRSEEVLAEGSGTFIKEVALAAERHMLFNFNQYSAGLPIAGVAVPLRPTLTELVNLARLNPGFPTAVDSMPTRQSLQIDILPLNCPGPTCQLTALVCTTTPVTLGGAFARFDLAQTMVDMQGGSGGQSRQNFGSLIRGPVLIQANPFGNVEGIVCGSSMIDASFYARFVQIQDTRDPDLQGPLSVAGAVNFAGVTTIAGATTVNNNMTVTGSSTAGSFTTAGTSTAGKVQLSDVAAVNTACTTNGLMAKDATGQILSCQSSVWKVQGDGKCIANGSDLNFLEDDGRCYNGVGNANSPAGVDWFFLEVYRHVNPANYHTFQRVVGMTGASVGKTWTRNQQSAVSGAGWSSWVLTSTSAAVGDACAPNGATARSTSGVTLLCVGGTYQGMDTIIRSGAPNSACTVTGATAIDTTASNETLLCRTNPAWPAGGLRYMRLREITQNLTFVQSVEVTEGSTVNQPVCTGYGSASTPIIQLAFKSGSTSDGGIAVYATVSGATWIIAMRNGADAALGGTPKAIAHIYCYFD